MTPVDARGFTVGEHLAQIRDDLAARRRDQPGPADVGEPGEDDVEAGDPAHRDGCSGCEDRVAGEDVRAATDELRLFVGGHPKNIASAATFSNRVTAGVAYAFSRCRLPFPHACRPFVAFSFPAFALLIVLIAGILIASMTVARSLHKSSNESFVGDAIPLKAAVQDLVLQMVNQQTGQRGYVITANRNVLGPYYAGREATRTDLATIDRLLARHPRMASLVERARPQIASLERFYGEQIALVDSGPAGQVRAARRVTELGDVQFNRFRATARLMLADTDKFAQDAKRSQDTRYTTILIFIGVVGAAALLIAAGLAVWTLRHTNAHVEELDATRTRAEESLAGERRATAEVDTLVGRFQESLLPVVGVTDPRVRLATLYRPGEERLQLGGDFYDFLELPNGSLAMLIGDVTGHGPNAAALGASLRTAWRALILDETDLGELPRLMQRLLGLERETEESFATACYGSVDETRSSLSVVLAGHPAPLLLDGDDCVAVEAPIGPPLGVVDEAAWRPRTIELPDRPTVVFFTDGLMEGRADPGSARSARQ